MTIVLSIKDDFGAVGDGVADETAAFLAATASGRPVFVPYGEYRIVGQALTFDEGGLIGEGHGTSIPARKSSLKFYNLPDTTRGAINTRVATGKGGFVRLENLSIEASSWDPATGALGYGLDIEAPAIVRNVQVIGFRRSNVWTHHNVGGGPYESIFENVRASYSGEHGFLVGTGANAITFINPNAMWNGAPGFMTAPTAPGSYDGFHVDQTADGGPYPPYNPQAVTIIGGDCSENSRYGWDFQLVTDSFCAPAYAESNLQNQAHVGSYIKGMFIVFQAIAGGVAGVTNDDGYGSYLYTNRVFVGGKRIRPLDVTDFCANPEADDIDASENFQNAPSRKFNLSRSHDGLNVTFIHSNATPDGTAVNRALETVATFQVYGTARFGVGSGVDHLKIGHDYVRLPQKVYQAIGPGWNAPTIVHMYGSGPPTTGTYPVGSTVTRYPPVVGQPKRWVCTALVSNTPGTWVSEGKL